MNKDRTIQANRTGIIIKERMEKFVCGWSSGSYKKGTQEVNKIPGAASPGIP